MQFYSAPRWSGRFSTDATQTRRVVAGIPHLDVVRPTNDEMDRAWWDFYWAGQHIGTSRSAAPLVKCPYGKPGDLLWVRETWKLSPGGNALYRADPAFGLDSYEKGWRPSIHMPRWASRITLEVTNVRVERVQDIGRDDAIAEGLPSFVSNLGARNSSPTRLYQTKSTDEGGYSSPIEAFENLWNTINAKRGYSWDSNPWVWVVEFKRVNP